MGKKVQPHFLIESFKSDAEGNNPTYKFKTNIQDDVSSQADAFKQIKMECVHVLQEQMEHHIRIGQKSHMLFIVKQEQLKNMMVINVTILTTTNWLYFSNRR